MSTFGCLLLQHSKFTQSFCQTDVLLLSSLSSKHCIHFHLSALMPRVETSTMPLVGTRGWNIAGGDYTIRENIIVIQNIKSNPQVSLSNVSFLPYRQICQRWPSGCSFAFIHLWFVAVLGPHNSLTTLQLQLKKILAWPICKYLLQTS